MGCDIHMYVEYRNRGSQDRFYSFGGHINPGRDYDVFATIAGVRARSGVAVKFQPRGLPKPPDEVAYRAFADNTLTVTGDGNGDRECSAANAERWVASGLSLKINDDTITHPDFHSHSWLTYEELRSALAPLLDAYSHLHAYRALLAAMKQLHDDGHEVRAVFWFDN